MSMEAYYALMIGTGIVLRLVARGVGDLWARFGEISAGV